MRFAKVKSRVQIRPFERNRYGMHGIVCSEAQGPGQIAKQSGTDTYVVPWQRTLQVRTQQCLQVQWSKPAGQQYPEFRRIVRCGPQNA